MMMKYPLPAIATWADFDRLLDWCELRKFNVWFRSTHHQAATRKSVFMMRKAVQTYRSEATTPYFLEKYEINFESDDCAIEYRLRFL
jgi:hypothetical protein